MTDEHAKRNIEVLQVNDLEEGRDIYTASDAPFAVAMQQHVTD